METSIATSLEQSQRLLDCGVSADTADMHWHGAIVPRGGSLTSMPEPSEEWDLWADPYSSMPEEMQATKLMEDYYEIQPAWSLSRLLELLPKRINDEYNYQKYGFKIEYSLTFNDAPWQITYKGGTLVNPEYFFDKSPIEACVKAIEWLTSNGYKLNEQ